MCYVCRCLVGASPALLVVLVSASVSVPMLLSSLRFFRALQKWPTRVAYDENQCNFMSLRGCSRRPRCEKEVRHDAKASSKLDVPAHRVTRSLLFRARDARRMRWSEKSRLGVVSAPCPPKWCPNGPQSRQSRIRKATWSSKVSSVMSVWSFRRVRLVSFRQSSMTRFPFRLV